MFLIFVEKFGFKSESQQAIVGNLSGGERNRVQLAKLLKSGANTIILDEVRAELMLLYKRKMYNKDSYMHLTVANQ